MKNNMQGGKGKARQNQKAGKMRTGHESTSITSPNSNAQSSTSNKDLENSGESECRRFERGKLVWVRIKGFPWWPGITVNESDVPEKLKKVWPQ